jgi:uncharacterized protein (TIGR01777 family)
MKIVISGANGFVGKELQKMFRQSADEIVIVKRDYFRNTNYLAQIVDGVDVVINLSGANIVARWSEKYKKELYDSRINTTNALIEAFEKTIVKPKLFISTSAVGVYDNQSTYSEDDTNYATDFLGKLAIDWENTALKANEFGIRTAIFRFGIVLGRSGGALQKMLTPFKLGVGGKIGSGKQGFSFIHIEDLKNAYKYLIANKDLKGVFNLTAPIPTDNLGLTKALGKSLHRPTIFPVPEFVLQLIFSEGAKILTDGQKVIPKRLQEHGFNFQFMNIENAIEDLVK